MINRKTPPPITVPDKISFDRAEKQLLENGLELFSIEAGLHDVLGIDFIWKTGTVDCTNQMVAKTAFKMLTEGTSTKKSSEISSIFDFYGAYTQSFSGTNFSGISLYCLSKYVSELLSLVFECIQQPIFPEKELSTYIQNKVQKIRLEEEKVGYLTRKHFYAKTYGENSVFGYTQKTEDVKSITTSEVKAFYEDHIKSSPFFVLVTGKDTKLAIDLFKKYDYKVSENHKETTEIATTNSSIFTEFMDKKGAIQNGIRLGKPTVGAKHPDYHLLTIANTVLGGYFGSRLMANIREDKGYTYGIFSTIRPLTPHESIWFIGTEVGSDVSDAAVAEIKKEIKILSEEPVSLEELTLVKNYLIGSFLSKVDGAFALADRFKELHHLELEYSFYDDYIETIKAVTPEILTPIFAKYFNVDSFSTLVVGSK